MPQSELTDLVLEPNRPSATPEDVALHQLGLRYRDAVEVTKGVTLVRAIIVYEARAIYGGRGRDSQFGAWLERYAPDLSPKQAQRLANIAEYMAEALKLDSVSNLSEHESRLKNFKLTALYHLATSAVPAKAREEA